MMHALPGQERDDDRHGSQNILFYYNLYTPIQYRFIYIFVFFLINNTSSSQIHADVIKCKACWIANYNFQNQKYDFVSSLESTLENKL